MKHSTTASSVVALLVMLSGCSRPAAEPQADAAAPSSPAVPSSPPAAASAPPATSAPAEPSAAAPAAEPAPSAAPTSSVSATSPGHKVWDPKDETVAVAAKNTLALLQKKEHDPSMKLTGVVSAESELAAGLNFFLKLSLSTAKGPKTADVHVFRDLKNVYTLIKVDGL